jgi:hypothetical protein
MKRSTRPVCTLAAFFALSLTTLALPLRTTYAQLPTATLGGSSTITVFEVVAANNVTLTVNGQPVQLGRDYGPNDVVRATSAGSGGSFVLYRSATGQVPGMGTFGPAAAATDASFQAIWAGD